MDVLLSLKTWNPTQSMLSIRTSTGVFWKCHNSNSLEMRNIYLYLAFCTPSRYGNPREGTYVWSTIKLGQRWRVNERVAAGTDQSDLLSAQCSGTLCGMDAAEMREKCWIFLSPSLCQCILGGWPKTLIG